MDIQKFHETSWFFGLIMIVLFVVSYFFWGIIFLGPSKPQGRLERGLHNTVNTVSQQGGSQRGVLPGMGGSGRRTSGQTTIQGGGSNNSRITTTTTR